jgi:hypothetical protein
MQTFLQHGKSTQRPVWLQVIALLCVLMVCVMSTVQVAHNHTDSVPLKQNKNHNGPAPDDHCPLCVAMHSALPVSVHAPDPVLQVQTLDKVAADALRVFRWRFEMACRPPPTNTDRA